MCICLSGIALVLNIQISSGSLLTAYFGEMTNHHKSKNAPFVTSRFCEIQDFCSTFSKDVGFFTEVDTYIRTYVSVQVQECTQFYSSLILKLFMRKYRNFL